MIGILRRSLTWVALLMVLAIGPAATLRAQRAPEQTGGGPNNLPAAWTAPSDSPPAPQQDTPNPGYVERRLLVRFAPNATAAQKAAIHTRYGAQVIREIPQINLQVLQFANDDALAMVSAYQAQEAVNYAEPDYIAAIPETELINHQLGGTSALGGPTTWAMAGGLSSAPLGLDLTPNDPLFSQQWHQAKINTAGAWDLAKATGVVIAIVDTGSTCNHPDLVGKCLAGYDYANNDSDPTDDQGHGTHVSGIAAALTNNGVGGAGVAWDAKILPVKVLGASGSGSHSAIASGIIWAADHGADVINMSLGGQFTTNALRDAVAYAISKNVVVVAAAGNDNTSNPSYPASYPGVICVAATTQSDTKASFSNYGTCIDVASPGVGILSSVMNGSYQAWSGTSMASPIVAGLAGLLKGQNKAMSPDQVQRVIEDTADDLGSPGRDTIFGAGRINVARAVQRNANGTPPATSAPPNQGPPTATATQRPSGPTPTTSGDWIQQVEDLINRERANLRLAPLATNGQLRQAANRQATDLGNTGRCGHDGSDGSTPYDRMRDAGYTSPYGEIVACGQTSPAAAVAAWMNSDGHRAIILCTSCTEFGAGVKQTSNGFRLYYVVNFGSRRVSAPTPTTVRQATNTPVPPTAVPRTSTPAPPTATSLPGTTDLVLAPGNNRIGWVVSSQPSLNHFDDEDTFTGSMNNLIYLGAMQFDLDQIPTTAYLNFARLEMTGRETRYLNGKGGTWSVHILPTTIDADFASAGYSTIRNAGIDDSLLPLLGKEDLGIGTLNSFNFTGSQLVVLSNRLRGSRKITFRMNGPETDPFSNVFSWDTGFGPDTRFRGPRLILNYSGVPPGPRPTLTPTEPPPPSPTPRPPTAGPTPTPSITPVPPTATSTAPPPPATNTPTATLPPPVPTADSGDSAVEIRPGAAEDVGWVRQLEPRNHFGDVNTFTGYYQGLVYRGAVQFDLSSIPPAVRVRSARLTLTGLSTHYLSPLGNGQWSVQVLSPASDANWRSQSFASLDTAPILGILAPVFAQGDLDVGKNNVFIFRDSELRMLEARAAGTRKLSLLFDGPRSGSSNMYDWDSGFGAGSRQPPVLSVVFGPPSETEPQPTATPAPNQSGCAQSVIDVINRERTRAGPLPLRTDAALTRAADAHTRDMIANNFFSHTGSDGSSPADRAARAGYPVGAVGEVLAAQSPDVEAVVAAWLNRAQRDEVLNPTYVDIGAACYFSAQSVYGYYWTVVMGRP